MTAAGQVEAQVRELPRPYLLFLGDNVDPNYAKTAFGLRDWAGELCIGEYALPGATTTTGLPVLTPAEAAAKGARSLVIGVVVSGGMISPKWIPTLIEAIEAGLDIVSGMHARLVDIPELKAAADRAGRALIDIRTPPRNLPVGKGLKRGGKRLLTVGTDCALGKKYTALAIARGLKARGLDVDFRATGQTGIMIAGRGIPMDAVVGDFISGAAEILSPDAAPDHWDVIEGQASLFHPSYAGVSLGLLHGSQPDVFVICHEAGRTTTMGHPTYPLPSIEEVMDLTIRQGSRTNKVIRCAGVSLNTAKLGPEEAEAVIAAECDRLGMPVADPMRPGPAFEKLLDACIA
ncbi:DUF1611 domain-containing protein [Sphingosinicella rhizophila]|uniref:DUF1611 domain-containing protein n=1 Tax=Sphingosinicella rhizophila TaxID=3050082 RepID=A0ABU3Q639_9SPHN|nr:DUF1611 domain-containing protein [Sphingosinicella sp. GR2756]MDT9598881.1 DUF1611 domain-containing protein [Sphingosinicella sp. GR2756]